MNKYLIVDDEIRAWGVNDYGELEWTEPLSKKEALKELKEFNKGYIKNAKIYKLVEVKRSELK